MKKSIAIVLSLFMLLTVCSSGPVMAQTVAWHGGGQLKIDSSWDSDTDLDWGQKNKHKFSGQVNSELQINLQLQHQGRHGQNSKKSYFDVEGHWAGSAIADMSELGIFTGYPDGSFKPDKSLTQAEAIALLMRIIAENDENFDYDDWDEELGDVPDWARSWVWRASYNGVINCNRFHSDVQASRLQTAIWIAKALDLEPVDVDDYPFVDCDSLTDEELGYLLALYEAGIIKGDGNACFNPSRFISRAEMAIIIETILSSDYDYDDDDEDIIPEEVIMTKKLVLEQGESANLRATVIYSNGEIDHDLSWSSSDSSIAKVKDGKVTASDDETGTAIITARASRNGESEKAQCRVVVTDEDNDEDDEEITASLEATGHIEVRDGEIYEEYELEAEGKFISLKKSNIKSIKVSKDGETKHTVKRTEESSLWFNVQNESGDYLYTIVDDEGSIYNATIEWKEPREINVKATGEKRKYTSRTYKEYEFERMDISSCKAIFQIRPDNRVIEWDDEDDETLWLRVNNQQDGEHLFLMKKGSRWYKAIIEI